MSLALIGGFECSNPSDEIEKLFTLKEKGILTEDEIQEKKKQLLGLSV